MQAQIPKNFYFKTASLGLKKSGKDDLLLIASEKPAICAGVFTQNSFPGAPIIVSKKHLKISQNKIQAILANSGCSNVATGEQGIKDSESCANLAAQKLQLKKENILVSSTGVIGRFLPMDKMRAQIPALINSQNKSAEEAAGAIMTTDTRQKIAFSKAGKAGILGIAKGVGMIEPNMATMLAFVITDAKIELKYLQKIWQEIVNETFNMLSVDACESTSDMAIVMANNIFEVKKDQFKKALKEAALDLTRQLARDGEGATILIETQIKNAPSPEKARSLAKSVIKSDLVKTAVHGRDANWGRIIQALGATHIKLDAKKIKIKIDGELVFQNGAPAKNINESKIFQKENTIIEIDLNAGEFNAKAWGCDLSQDYIKINADYRS